MGSLASKKRENSIDSPLALDSSLRKLVGFQSELRVANPLPSFRRMVMAEAFNPYYKWLGIPPEELPPNHYRLLGVQLFEPDREVIATAADRQMAHVQTYKTGKYAAMSQQVLNEISAARLTLLNPKKKQHYDQQIGLNLEKEEAPQEEPISIQVSTSNISHPTVYRSARWQSPLAIVVLLACVGLPIALLVFLSSAEENKLAAKRDPQSDDRQPQLPEPRKPKKRINPVQRVNSSNPTTVPAEFTKLAVLPEFERGETIDVLSLIDPEENAYDGSWQKDSQGFLISPAVDRPRLVLPVDPPSEYELRILAQRVKGMKALKIGLVSGKHQFGAIFDAYNSGDISGLHLIDGLGADRNDTKRQGAIFTAGKPVEIVCRVYKHGVYVALDGKRFYHWQGDPASLSLWQGWDVKAPSKLFLGSLESSYRFQQVQLTRLTSK